MPRTPGVALALALAACAGAPEPAPIAPRAEPIAPGPRPPPPGCTVDRWCVDRPAVPFSGGNAVWVYAADDVWVGGHALFHWDGARWTTSPGPSAGDVADLWGVEGALYVLAGSSAFRVDASGWTDLALPSSGSARYAIWASGPDDVWVGGAFATEHWDGSAWTRHRVTLVELVSAEEGAPAAITDSGQVAIFHEGAWRAASPAYGRLAGLSWGGGELAVVGDEPPRFAVRREGRWIEPAIDEIGARAVWTTPSAVHVREGPRGTMLHLDGARVTDHPIPPELRLTAIHGAGEDLAVAVGLYGVLRWDGRAWSRIGEPRLPDLAQVRGRSADDVVAIGGPSVVHFDGTGWTEEREPPPRAALRAVWGRAPDDAWAVGDGGRILRITGATVAPVASPTQVDLRAAWGASADAIWAVGDGGAIVRWDGARWRLEESPTDRALFAISGTSASDVWAGGSDGVLLRRDAAGWSVVEHALVQPIRVLAAIAPDDVWAGGLGGGLERFDGRSWEARPPLEGSPTGLFARSRGTLHVAGVYHGVRRIHAETGTHSEPLRRANAVAGARSAGFAVGDAGHVARLDGAAWVAAQAGEADLFGVWAGAPDAALAVGEGDTVVRYDGATWARIHGEAPVRSARPSHHALSAWDEGFLAVGAQARWIGGGARPVPPGEGFRDAWGSAADDVYVVSGTGALQHFDGTAWREEALPDAPAPGPSALAGAGSTVYAWNDRRMLWRRGPAGWARIEGVTHSIRDAFVAGDGGLVTVGSGGVIRHLDGTTWTDASDTRERLQHVALFGERGAVALGYLGVVVLYDGARWRALPTSGATEPWDVWAASADDVWVAARNGLHRWDGAAWTRLREDRIRRVWGAGPADVFVVREDGRVERWDGTAWTTSRDASACCDNDLVGAGADDVFLVGTHGAVHFDGAAWTELPDVAGGLTEPVALGGGRLIARNASPYEYVVRSWDGAAWSDAPALRYHTQFGAAPDGTRFAVRSVREIHRWDGAAWVDVTHPDMQTITDVAVRSSTDAIAVGDNGQRWHWDGRAWRDGRRGSSEDLEAVWGTGRDDVFAVGAGGCVLHYDGTEWSAMESGTEARLNAVHGRSGTDVWAAGADGTVLHYDGTAWRREETGSRAYLRDVRAIGARVFAVGSEGTILRREP